ncbi:HdeD family acid-resistance protein [Streptomyces sp. NPDC088254]|uniref:HdeD family acid-resistance protein n=1 Tax=Streptomyces sp. NPDC088254 TaxID=3365847 RepID=UPI003803E7EC
MTEPREPAPQYPTGGVPVGGSQGATPPGAAGTGAMGAGGEAWDAGGGAAGDPAQFLAVLGRSWLWVLGSAIATLVPGVIVLVWPEETLHVLAVLIGLYLLAAGVFRFVGAFARDDHGERLPGLLLAVLYVLGGVLCLRNPLQTIAALSLIVGAVWLVSGIVTLFTAVGAKNLPHRGIVIGAAALAVVAGVVVLALPTESARALTRLLGLWLVLLGLVEVVIAFAWRAAVRRSGATG